MPPGLNDVGEEPHHPERADSGEQHTVHWQEIVQGAKIEDQDTDQPRKGSDPNEKVTTPIHWPPFRWSEFR